MSRRGKPGRLKRRLAPVRMVNRVIAAAVVPPACTSTKTEGVAIRSARHNVERWIQPVSAPRTPLMARRPRHDIWQDGRLLVLRKGAVLPDRCVKCNSAEGYRLNEPSIGAPSGNLSNGLLCTAALCPHRGHRAANLSHGNRPLPAAQIEATHGNRDCAWLLFLVAIGGFFLAVNTRGDTGGTIALVSVAVLVASPFVGLFAASTVRANRRLFWLAQRVCPEYLAELPQSPVPR